MIPVSTLWQVGAHNDAFGFSCLYEPLVPGGAPERMTFLYLRDGKGYAVNGIFTDAATVARLIS